MRTLLLTLALTVSVWGADAPKPVPRLTASPAATALASDQTPLSVGKFLFISIASYDGPVTFDIGGQDRVKVLAVKSGQYYGGIKEGQDEPNHHMAPDSKSEVLVALGSKPGECVIAAWGIVDQKPVKLATITIVVGGAKPQPMPDPKPGPNPDPKPYSGDWQVLFLEETGEAAATRGLFLTDPDLLAYVKAKCKSPMRVADKDVKAPDGKPPKDLVPYLERAKGKPLPYWFVVAKDGTVLIEGAAPKLPADALAALKRIGG